MCAPTGAGGAAQLQRHRQPATSAGGQPRPTILRAPLALGSTQHPHICRGTQDYPRRLSIWTKIGFQLLQNPPPPPVPASIPDIAEATEGQMASREGQMASREVIFLIH